MITKVLLVCFCMIFQDDVSLLKKRKSGNQTQRLEAAARIDELIARNEEAELDEFANELVDEIVHNPSVARSDMWDFTTLVYLSRIAKSAPSCLAPHANKLAGSLQKGSENRQVRLLSVATRMGEYATGLYPTVESQIRDGESLLVRVQALAAAFAITRKADVLEKYLKLSNSGNSDEQLVFATTCQSISPVPVEIKQAVSRLVESKDIRVRVVAALTLYQWNPNDRKSLEKLLDALGGSDVSFNVVGFSEPAGVVGVKVYVLSAISKDSRLTQADVKQLCQVFVTDDDILILQNLCRMLLNTKYELHETIIRELDSIHSKIGEERAKRYAMTLKTLLIEKRKTRQNK